MRWGELSSRILKVLEDGPMTRAEICQALITDKESVSSILSRLRRDIDKVGKRIYVKSYVWDMEGARHYPRAMYELGNKPDAPKPKPDLKKVKSRYYAKLRMKRTANSVFNLGLPREVWDRRVK